MPRKILPFKLKETDRELLTAARENITLFTQWYFDGWTPIPWQHEFVHAPQKRKMVVAGIRSGKTKIAAAGFLHYMFFNPGCRIANASISADQANIVYYDCLDFAQRPRFQHWVEDVQRHPYPRIRLINGSEAWFRSIGYEAELWRGHEFDLINIDEAAYVTNEMAIKTLEGRLLGSYQIAGLTKQRAGILWMTTSPKGRTWLYERWKLGDPDYPGCQLDRYWSKRARTFDNPNISPEALQDLMSGWTQKMIDQELNGVFVDSDGAQFSYEDVMDACTPTVRDLEGSVVSGRVEVDHLVRQVHDFFEARNASKSRREDMDFYELEPEKGHYYVNSWDLGKRPNKLGRNATVGGVVDITERPWRLVAYRYSPGTSYSQSQTYIEEWDAKYNQNAICQSVIDATGKGDVMNEELTDQKRIDVEGIVYSASTKPLMIDSLRIALERKQLVFPFIRRMVDQLQSYEYPDDKIAQDIVMMLAQAAHVGRIRSGEVGKKASHERAIIATARQSMNSAAMDRLRQRRQAVRTTRLPGRTA